VSIVVLIIGITAIGMAPLWLSDMINNGLVPVMQRILIAGLPIH
jgi:hypothetical protein